MEIFERGEKRRELLDALAAERRQQESQAQDEQARPRCGDLDAWHAGAAVLRAVPPGTGWQACARPGPGPSIACRAGGRPARATAQICAGLGPGRALSAGRLQAANMRASTRAKTAKAVPATNAKSIALAELNAARSAKQRRTARYGSCAAQTGHNRPTSAVAGRQVPCWGRPCSGAALRRLALRTPAGCRADSLAGQAGDRPGAAGSRRTPARKSCQTRATGVAEPQRLAAPPWAGWPDSLASCRSCDSWARLGQSGPEGAHACAGTAATSPRAASLRLPRP